MTKFLSIIGVAFALWMQVVPNGADYCTGNKTFNYHPLNSAGREAGVKAQAAFCKVVNS